MLDGGFVDQATVFLSLVCEFGPRLGHVEQFQFGVECCVSSQRLHHFPASTLAIASSVLRSAGPTLHKLGNHFLRRRFLVSSDVPSAIAFCRTAPSVRPNLPAICLAGAFFAKDLSSRMSFAVHPRRFAIGSPLCGNPLTARLNSLRRDHLRGVLSTCVMDRQGAKISMPVPSTTPATAAVWSALPSRNSRVIIPTRGRMTSEKTNSASATRWVLTAALTSAKLVGTGAGTSEAVAVITLDILRLREP